ncbi:MAG: HAD family hydrolase [Synergistaceae bacterium]|jgi:HAD superfamily hydrolase (TIGR01549 family)|nr:HAD family hydrolase [Synergistaceae bacterium]
MSENTNCGSVFSAALFDFDMTLMDTSYIITDCTNLLAERFGLRSVTRDEVLSVIGLEISDSWVSLWGRFEDEWLDYYRKHFRAREQSGFREFPDTRSAVSSLRENGVKTGVVSNRHFASATVKKSGIAHLFDVVVGLEDVRNAKPHPEPILTALSRLSSVSNRAFYVGDTDTDMKAAVASGVTGIGVTTGNYGADALKAAGAAVSCPNLTCAAGVILKLGGSIG